jgi:hypothetical protein
MADAPVAAGIVDRVKLVSFVDHLRYICHLKRILRLQEEEKKEFLFNY